MQRSELPTQLTQAYAGWTWLKVWEYPPDTATFRLEALNRSTRFLKVAPSSWHPGLADECRRVIWAHDHLAVPKVVECGSNDLTSWLVTEEVVGRDATHPGWKADPKGLVRLLAEGLRRFHHAPVGQCPSDFRLDAALPHVRSRVEAGLVDPTTHFHPEHSRFTPDTALEFLERNRPSSEDLVVCHGDYCFPNVLIEDWTIVGYLDLAELGVADRWWDVAVATWSTTWNLGPEWDRTFLDAYGIEEDPDRMTFFRLLYDLAS